MQIRVSQEAQLLQTDRKTRYVSKLVLLHELWELEVLNSKSDLQGHSKALTMVPFNRPHMISY